MQNENQRLGVSMRSPEIYTDQEIHGLQKTVVIKFEMTEKIIGADEQGEKVQGQNLIPPVHIRVRDDLPRVLTSYSVITSEKESSSKCPKGTEVWTPIGMSDLKEIKQTILSYDLHSAFVREMVKTWASSNKATTHNWLQFVSTVLDDGPQLL